MNLSFPIHQTEDHDTTQRVLGPGAGAKGDHLLPRVTPRAEGGTETHFLDGGIVTLRACTSLGLQSW